VTQEAEDASYIHEKHFGIINLAPCCSVGHEVINKTPEPNSQSLIINEIVAVALFWIITISELKTRPPAVR